MEAYQQRVINEKSALDDKIKSLSEFIDNNPAYIYIDKKEKRLMRHQLEVMDCYATVLELRISNFNLC